MRSACLRQRAKGIRCSCRTTCAVERDILARVVPSRASSVGLIFSMCVCVCVCVCVFIKLHITTQSGPVILVILCHSH